MSAISVRITRVRDTVPLPSYATPGSVAFDLCCAVDTIVPAKGIATVPTGLIIATPPGYALILAPRSSLFRKTGLRLGNTVGIIDQDFCGPDDELELSFWNPSEQPILLKAGDRMVQGLLVNIARAEWNEGPATSSTSRGGWGNSGGYTNTTMS